MAICQTLTNDDEHWLSGNFFLKKSSTKSIVFFFAPNELHHFTTELVNRHTDAIKQWAGLMQSRSTANCQARAWEVQSTATTFLVRSRWKWQTRQAKRQQWWVCVWHHVAEAIVKANPTYSGWVMMTPNLNMCTLSFHFYSFLQIKQTMMGWFTMC